MVLPPKVTHPKGEQEIQFKMREILALIADTFTGKIHIEKGARAQVTTLARAGSGPELRIHDASYTLYLIRIHLGLNRLKIQY